MPNFCPVLWKEEPAPEDLINCDNCGLLKHGSRMVWGEGNPRAPIMIILDNPGAREDRNESPFVCGTRQTLQQGASEVGLSEENLYITYILKRKPTRAYDKEHARQACMLHLEQQIINQEPKLVLCLGNVAVQSFFQNPEADVKKLRGLIHNVQGYPTTVGYHPLAVRRRPTLWSLFRDDWRQVANYVNT